MESNSKSEFIIVPKETMKKFLFDCMIKVGTDASHAFQLADVLVVADYRGHFSHGLNRLEMYVNDVNTGTVKMAGEPTILQEKTATAWVDGKNLLGPVVGNFCMELAIKKSKEAGVGWVVAKVAFPTRSAKAALGTNAISLAAPAKCGDSFVLDMASTTAAIGKIEIAHRKGEKEVPLGWGVDSCGRDTHNVEEIRNGGGLHYLGGQEVNGGYKGYGIGMMVEILCGILGGATWGPNIRMMGVTNERDADLGQCFVAIDPDAFAPWFPERLQNLLDTCRNLPPAEGHANVLVAGDPEKEHMKMCDELGGIPYHKNQIKFTKEIANKLHIDPPLLC